jgi:hypothetical protein
VTAPVTTRTVEGDTHSCFLILHAPSQRLIPPHVSTSTATAHHAATANIRTTCHDSIGSRRLPNHLCSSSKISHVGQLVKENGSFTTNIRTASPLGSLADKSSMSICSPPIYGQLTTWCIVAGNGDRTYSHILPRGNVNRCIRHTHPCTNKGASS